jgi:homocysteine S-methyltransferase
LPIAVSFTVETDGRLPTGMSIAEAIEWLDQATDATPLYYMINCAHPTHFIHQLESDASWVKRIRGVRANASTRSHAELDAAPDLDAGDPVELAQHYRQIRDQHSQITILGGCCGTDRRHIEQIGFACVG